MAKSDDGYKGDLEGRPVPNAVSMRCGVCLDGTTVGVDLLDANDKTIAHGHLDVETALEFAEQFAEALAELVASLVKPH